MKTGVVVMTTNTPVNELIAFPNDDKAMNIVSAGMTPTARKLTDNFNNSVRDVEWMLKDDKRYNEIKALLTVREMESIERLVNLGKAISDYLL